LLLDDRRLIDTELDAGAELNAAEWRAAPVEKATPVEEAGAVENAVAGRWPGGEEGWRVAALECGGERGWWSVGCGGTAVWSRWSTHGGELHGGVVALEHACGGVDATVVR
jgi:hypothetical protein